MNTYRNTKKQIQKYTPKCMLPYGSDVRWLCLGARAGSPANPAVKCSDGLGL